MKRCFPRPLTSATSTLLAAALLASTPACAVSQLFSRPAQVVLRDGKPCLYAPLKLPAARSAPQWWDVSVSVAAPNGQFVGAWEIDVHATPPSSPEQCLVYGDRPEQSKSRLPAAPLRNEMTAYEAILGIGTPGQGARYGVRFCYGQAATGVAALTRWDEKSARCTAEPLSFEAPGSPAPGGASSQAK